MTNYNKATLANTFSQNDIPQGSDFSNLIYSQVNLVETVTQTMAGGLSTTELNSPLVSAANGNFTGNLTATTLLANNLSMFGVLSANVISSYGNFTNTANIICSAANFSGPVIASQGIFNNVVILSAAGTTQATAAPITGTFVRGQGSSDGQATGFMLPANRSGLISYFVHEGAVSANLWPPTGGKINGLSTNVPFALAATTPYTIYYTTASAYAVK